MRINSPFHVRNLLSLGMALLCGTGLWSQPIPLDPAVRTGRINNGFTYYIRHNEEPARQVQLYLVCNVGSVLEDDDQQGLAHFMEHMNFNGTRHFPKNEMVDYLQKAGVRFGADLNAHTGFDETVYQLPLPTQDTALVNNGLQIMRDWAQEATLDPVELNKERGVVLEEERLGKGAKDRMSRLYLPMMVNHSRYAQRLPIGKDSILLHFSPDIIRRFHHDWYRPDLQALIVVGDIDVPVIEEKIKELFADLKNPKMERPRITYTVPVNDHPQFMAVTDKEEPSTEMDIYIKHKVVVSHSEGDYLEGMRRTLFNSLVAARRVAELSADADPAYISSSSGIQSFVGGTDFFAFEVTAKERQLEKAFRQTWAVVEKIRRDGFTPAELDRAKLNYLRGMEEAVKEKSKTPSSSFVAEYQRLFLAGEASPGIDWEYAFAKTHLNDITLADIRRLTAEYLDDPNQDILVMAPEKDKNWLPDRATVTGWVKGLQTATLVAYKDVETPKALLSALPSPGKTVASKLIEPIQTTELTLSNGVKVVLKPTDFKNDEITFKAYASGGVSVFDDKDYDAAAAAVSMVTSFGLGEFNPVQLGNTLTGKAVKVAPYIGNRSQGVTGTSSVADLETALQLVYLYFTAPRRDSVLYNNIITRSRELLSNRNADPANVFTDTMSYVMGNYHYRNAPPSVARLDRISLQKVMTAYHRLFSDASAFTFVFVGNLAADSIRPLLELYLGALPSTYQNQPALDLGIHIPAGRLIKKVYKGKEDKALVRLVYSGDYVYSPENNQYIHALGQILQIKVLQHLREAESEVYSPSVQSIYNKYPSNRYAFVVAFGCAPRNVDHLAAMVDDELRTLREKGPDTNDIGKYKEAYKKNMELALQNNGFWLDYLESHYENKEDLMEIKTAIERLDVLTPSSLQTAAGRYLDGKNNIRFALLPETAVEKPAVSYPLQVIKRKGITLVFIDKSRDFDPALQARMIETFFTVYPQEMLRFNPHALKQVTFVVDPAYHGVAATQAGIIRFDPSYFREFPNDVDVVTHETMHVVQAYKSQKNGWITEGIADYARYKYGVDNAGSGWQLPLFYIHQKYTDSYRVTARFFTWLERKTRPDIVDRIDALMRSGKYSRASWNQLTGKTVDQLWQEYSDSLGTP